MGLKAEAKCARPGVGILNMATPTGDTTKPATARRRLGQRLGLNPRGQSLVEFAISFPIVMMMILFGIDFGRVFMGWVTLNNAVREAANFAAINPNAWTGSGNAAEQAEYARLINAESGSINCTLPNPLPAPTFPAGTDIGSPATVSVTCRFSLITPLIKNILGNAINVSASAAFPVRSGYIAGSGFTAGLPSVSPGAATPTPAPTGTAIPTASPFPTPSAIPTSPPMCTVPDFFDTQTTQATRTWTTAGFVANNLSFNPLVPPNYKIKTQTLTKATVVLCSSTMTVAP
jgi:Flp pilus assembly protein TadG